MVSRTASAQAARTGSSNATETRATSPSAQYLTANCQPLGSLGREVISGRPPRCSIVSRCVIFSKAADEGDRDPELLAAVDEPQEDVTRRGREGDDHLPDPVS